MRGILGLLGLLITLLLVGLLVRQQISTVRPGLPVVQQPTKPAESIPGATNPVALPAPGAAASSSAQVEQQFKQALDQAMQPRSQAADTP